MASLLVLAVVDLEANALKLLKPLLLLLGIGIPDGVGSRDCWPVNDGDDELGRSVAVRRRANGFVAILFRASEKDDLRRGGVLGWCVKLPFCASHITAFCSVISPDNIVSPALRAVGVSSGGKVSSNLDDPAKRGLQGLAPWRVTEYFT